MADRTRGISGFNPYAAGNKIYGGGRSFPTSGPVDKTGYRERDLKHRARKVARMRRLEALKKHKLMNPDVLRKG